MELLYPVRSTSPDGAVSGSGPVTVLVNRAIAAPGEKAFLASLIELLQEFDAFPGSSGSMVFRRETGDEVEFSILQRFATSAAHDAWLASPGFARWRSVVAPVTPTPGHVHRYSGMESFFVTAQAPDAPPRWKMVLLLLVAVYPVSLGVATWLAPALARVSLLAGTFLTSVLMVLTMTYVLVPILTKVFQGWLAPAPE